MAYIQLETTTRRHYYDYQGFLASPEAEKNAGEHTSEVVLLVFNLLFLYFLTLNGLARSLSDLSGLTKKSGAIPRGNWLLIVCGEHDYDHDN